VQKEFISKQSGIQMLKRLTQNVSLSKYFI